MANALYALGRAAFHRRRAVVAAWSLLVLAAGLLAAGVGQGTNNVFEIPGTQSQEALERLDRTFPEVSGASAQVVARVPDGQSVTSQPARAAITQAISDLEQIPDVTQVTSPYPSEGDGATAPKSAGLISQGGDAAIITVQFAVPATEISAEQKDALVDVAAALSRAGMEAAAGGQAFTNTGPGVTVTEVFGVIVALLVLLVTFRAVAPAVLPIVSAVVSAAAAMAFTSAATGWIDISSTTPLLGLMIGLAVGIDYGLFIVSRHRELLADGLAPDEAAARSTATAGSAVVFAGITVVTALLALSVPGIPFLRIMGVFAALAVALAVAAALTVLPAAFGFLGGRLRPAAREPRAPRRRTAAERERGVMARWVAAVTRWPLATIVVVVVGLGVLAVPARDLQLALPDTGSAERDSSERQAYDLVAAEFGEGYNAPLLVSVDLLQSSDPVAVMADLSADVSGVPGVSKVALATPNPSGDTGIVLLFPSTAPSSPETAELVQTLRDRASAWDERHEVTVAVTGQTALQIDTSERLGEALVPFGLLVVGICLVLLMVVFRSLVIPLAAAAGYLLSVGAAFGAVVLVFQRGWGAEIVGVDPTGPVVSFLPIILMGVLFGLAMDYHIFLVSRMKEEHARGASAHDAVSRGFVGSAPIVTSAALIMFCVFAAFVPEGDATVKPIALGLAVGVLADAFLVRMIFIPALLVLVGERAWRLPARLDRVLPHVDIEGESVRAQAEAAAWPRPGGAPAIAAQGVTVLDADGRPLFAPVDVVVEPGETVVVEGPKGIGKTSFLLVLAGRMASFQGRLKVAGHLLSSDRAAVRRRVALAEFAAVNPLEESLSVDQHIAERLAASSFGLWVSRARVHETRRRLSHALRGAGQGEVEGSLLVSQLSALERVGLGVVLAGLSRPQIVMIDDVDVLRDPADLRAFWDALPELLPPGPSGRPTVVASAQVAVPGPDDLRHVSLVVPTHIDSQRPEVTA